MFQFFSDIGPPRVEKLKVVEKCQKVEIYLTVDLHGPDFSVFSGGQGAKSRKSDLHGPYFSVFSGGQGAKSRKSVSHRSYFSVFSGGQGAKSRKSIYMDLIFRCF